MLEAKFNILKEKLLVLVVDYYGISNASL